MPTEFKLPELGEELDSGTVIGVPVAEGDRVEEGQTVLELETDKAVVDVPSDVSGTVVEVLVEEGQEIEVGQVVLRLDNGNGEGGGDRSQESREEEGSTSGRPEEGVTETEPAGRREPAAAGDREDGAPESGSADAERKGEGDESEARTRAPAPAAPSVRRVARELGVDIDQVKGSGPNGRISREDVERYAKTGGKEESSGKAGESEQRAPTGLELPDFTRWGQVQRQPMSRVRRVTAERMLRSWEAIPQVTQFDRADITDLEQERRDRREQAEEGGARLTLTAVMVKIVGMALRTFPQFNASVDWPRREVVYKHYVNVGVAVDTERGLVVPVVRDVDRKTIAQLSSELDALTERAREGKLSVEDMRGANFTVSNAGALGGGAFTPIVNWPESAILGVGSAREEAVRSDEAEVQFRSLLPLALSYDHRLVDGADGVRFLRWVAGGLENPAKALWGV